MLGHGFIILNFEMSKRKYKPLPVTYSKKAKAETVLVQASRKSSFREQVERLIMSKAETKFVDNASVNATMPIAGQTVALSTVAQGTDYNQRIGNHVYSKYVHVRICIIPAVATPPNGCWAYRFSIILDKQPNAGLATYANIWDTSVVDAALAFRAANTYGDRFRVLKDIEGTVTPVGDNACCYHDEYINLEYQLDEKFRRAEYLGTAATVASWASNQILFAYGIANSGSTTTDLPTISYNVRYAFKDA